MKDPIYFDYMKESKYKSFFEKVRIGDIIQYSFFYSSTEIDYITKKCGIEIKHLLSLSKEYKIFGSCVFRIIVKHNLELDLKPLEPVMFDPKMLDL